MFSICDKALGALPDERSMIQPDRVSLLAGV
jgi:hypothetical protein